jgi:hypothetical protein
MIAIESHMRSQSFVLAMQLMRGSRVAELGLLLDELLEVHGDWMVMADDRWPA